LVVGWYSLASSVFSRQLLVNATRHIGSRRAAAPRGGRRQGFEHALRAGPPHVWNAPNSVSSGRFARTRNDSKSATFHIEMPNSRTVRRVNIQNRD
jgi:hypothetical protein